PTPPAAETTFPQTTPIPPALPSPYTPPQRHYKIPPRHQSPHQQVTKCLDLKPPQPISSEAIPMPSIYFRSLKSLVRVSASRRPRVSVSLRLALLAALAFALPAAD